MGKENMKYEETVDVLSDEGKKRLLKMKKKDLVNIIENVVTIHRLSLKILDSYGINYKRLLGDDE